LVQFPGGGAFVGEDEVDHDPGGGPGEAGDGADDDALVETGDATEKIGLSCVC
jgi:hypothetical protein